MTGLAVRNAVGAWGVGFNGAYIGCMVQVLRSWLRAELSSAHFSTFLDNRYNMHGTIGVCKIDLYIVHSYANTYRKDYQQDTRTDYLEGHTLALL